MSGRGTPDRIERRILAIMASDVVGYSRAMEADEAGTIRRVTEWQSEVLLPAIGRHRGRLVKLIGDGALAVFDSVVDAVTCAAEVQTETRSRGAGQPQPLLLRIGVNLGDVALVDGDIYGDGVNVAARLEQICAPGGIMISGTAFDHLQGKVPFPLEFAGEQRVKNIARPVRAYRALLDGKRRRQPIRLPRRALAAVFLLVLGLVGGWWAWTRWYVIPANASIAVLPFADLGGDEATKRLADGMTEDIITELTRFRALDVISRDATSGLRDQPIDIPAVGRHLRARYILAGAIQHQGDEVRISARLIDAGAARDVWSERWDRTTANLFAVQSEIAEEVANQMASPFTGELVAADRDAARRKPPKNLGAYDLYLLGIDALGGSTREGLDEAQRLLQRSLAIDPGFARAWTGLAMTYAGLAEMTGYPAEIEAERRAAAERAVALDPADAAAHAALATYFMDTGDAPRAKEEFAKALRLNPGSADLLSTYAGWASNFGEAQAGVDAAERALRLNPDPPNWALYNYAYAYFMAGRYEDALGMFGRMPVETYSPNTYVYRAATLGALGRNEAAEQAVADALAKLPDLSVERFAANQSSNPAERERLVETMRAAGFPLCASPATLAAQPRLPRLPECAPS